MSFAEFTYPLLQGWDWWQMYHDRAIQVQVGGGDQYGNIIAGMDAVNYIAQNEAEASGRKDWLDSEGRLKEDLSPFGLTVPLLTTSSGEKFGKSAGNAVWLDANLTSPFDLYGVSICLLYAESQEANSLAVPPSLRRRRRREISQALHLRSYLECQSHHGPA